MSSKSDMIVMQIDDYRAILNRQFEDGYINALLQLQNRLQEQWKPVPPNVKTVLGHIQDLILTCTNCGTKLLDKPCPTCAERKPQ